MQAVQPLLGSSLIDVQMSVTNAPGHATLLARASAGFTGIVAIGGDGTIAEVLAGMDIAHQRLAVIPAGHGNSLARDLGLIHTRQAQGHNHVGLAPAGVGTISGLPDYTGTGSKKASPTSFAAVRVAREFLE